jgi:hypothetical protein
VMTEGFERYFTVRTHAPRNTTSTMPTQMKRYTWSLLLIAFKSELSASLLICDAVSVDPVTSSPKCGADPA